MATSAEVAAILRDAAKTPLLRMRLTWSAGAPYLPRRKPKRLLEPLHVMRPDFGVDDARRALAVEGVEHLLGGDPAHVLAGFMGNAGGVRARQHVVELQQRMIRRRRLLGPDVEAGAGDLLVTQRVRQRVLVVDKAARRGDEIGVLLH